MSAICLVFFLCILAVDSQVIYPANNDGQQTLQDMLHILESQKKNSDLILLGQANITNILRTTPCKLQYQGEFVVFDEDVERSYKTSFDSCKSDCLKSTQCRTMYRLNGFCFIVNKDVEHSPYAGSMLYHKVCTGIYDDVREVLRQLSELIQKVNDISSEVKSLREGLTKANIIS